VLFGYSFRLRFADSSEDPMSSCDYAMSDFNTALEAPGK
jgi:hypothetical protein